MSFKFYPSIFGEINKIKQSKSYVDCKLVFSDGSLVVLFAKLVAAGIWWTKCKDHDIPPDNLVVIFPHHSLSYGLELVNKIYLDIDNDDRMQHDIDIPELIVRSSDILPTPPMSRSNSIVRSKSCTSPEDDVEVDICDNINVGIPNDVVDEFWNSDNLT